MPQAKLVKLVNDEEVMNIVKEAVSMLKNKWVSLIYCSPEFAATVGPAYMRPSQHYVVVKEWEKFVKEGIVRKMSSSKMPDQELFKLYKHRMRAIRYDSSTDPHVKPYTYTFAVLEDLDGRRIAIISDNDDENNGQVPGAIFLNATKRAVSELWPGSQNMYNLLYKTNPRFKHVSNNALLPALPSTTLLRDMTWKSYDDRPEPTAPPPYVESKLAAEGLLFCRSSSLFVPLQETGGGDIHFRPFHHRKLPYRHMLFIMDGARISGSGRVVASYTGDAYTNNNPFQPLCGLSPDVHNLQRWPSLGHLQAMIKDTYGKAFQEIQRKTRRGTTYSFSEKPKEASEYLLAEIADAEQKSVYKTESMSNEVVIDIELHDIVGVCIDWRLLSNPPLDNDDDAKAAMRFLHDFSRMAECVHAHVDKLHNPFQNVYAYQNISLFKSNIQGVGDGPHATRIVPVPNARAALSRLYDALVDSVRARNQRSSKRLRT